MTPIPTSLGQVAEQTAGGGEFGYLLADFLDRFYRTPLAGALEVEPVSLSGQQPEGAINDAYLAAVAESLATRLRWPVPAWAFGEARYLRRPYFGVQAAALRATLLLESPPAFRSRNLFVTGNVLSRA